MTTLGGQSLMRHIENQDLTAVVNILGSATISLDERDEDGQTFLMVACQLGNIHIVRELLDRPNCDVDAVDNDNWTALLNASKEGHIEVVEELLDRGAHIEHRDIGGWTALMWSCYKGHVAVTTELLERGANPNVKGEHHMTCLTWASGRGYLEIVQALLEKGAKVNTADKYGTTPLIWASRKGHREIVEMLLEEGATVDNAGMNSWTALIVAAKGGFTEVVSLILNHNPNVNSVDKDGYTALTLAAKDGHVDIVYELLQRGAYVNLPDRYGDTILIHSTKGGHLDVVKALLKKYADVDVQGVDNKTALYWAVEKGHANIAKMLLEFNADPSICTKDGDTPLLKAVRSRNLELVEALLNKGAKVSQIDRKGDTALHISVRGRSKRITEALLRNPKDGRLLYKPNRNGETPYQIDTTHQKSILTQIFGARHLNAEESIQGYDLYSSTIADVLSEPSLKTPITIGLYAKWGSGKSFLINKLQKEMKVFTALNPDPMFEFSWLQFVLCFFLSLIVGVTLALTVRWYVGLGVGLGFFFLQYFFLGLVWFGTEHRDWEWADRVGTYLAVRLQFLKLLLQVMFCNEPEPSREDTATVRFLFTDNARLASVVGEKSITGMIGTLFDAFEDEFGTLVTRLFRVFKPLPASTNGRFKSICCIPYFIIVLAVMLCIAAAGILLGVYGIHSIYDRKYTVIDGILIALAIIIGLAIISNLYTWGRLILGLVVSPRRRVLRIASQIETLKMEGMMQQLKGEVEWMGEMTRCMDSFLNTVTRLVVIVDGLDSCEQEKLLQVLDTVHMLFGDQDTPFVTILAVDPHVVIKGIEHNLHGLFRDSSINGHDYLRNIVHLPFFLQGQSLPRPYMSQNKESSTNINHLGDHGGSRRTHRNESLVSGSMVSLSEQNKRRKRLGGATSHHGSSNLIRQPSTFDLSKTLIKNTYFSDINPRNMRRLMNIVAVTGRLLRAFSIDFSWYRLASWINITEQWPYRLSWIILEVENNEDVEDGVTLKNIYDRIVPKMPPSKDFDPLMEIDRNPRKLEIFLSNHTPVLNVGDLRKFLPCTINVDPYLRKLIQELQQNSDNMQQEYSQYPVSPMFGGMDHSLTSRTTRRQQNRQEQLTTSPRGTPTPGLSRIPYAGYIGQGLIGAGSHMMVPPYMVGGISGVGLTSPLQPPPPPPKQSAQAKLYLLDEGICEKLSKMNVSGVCSLLRRLDGLSENRIQQYVETLQENNISGRVLLNCDLPELRTVMKMSFGDWELFRGALEALREREEQASDEPPTPSQPSNFTHEMQLSDSKPVKVPTPQYPHVSPARSMESVGRASSSGQTLGSGENLNADVVDHHSTDSFSTRHDDLYARQSTENITTDVMQSSSNISSASADPTMPKPILKKQDSFVGEFIYESNALLEAMESMGVEEDDTESEYEEEGGDDEDNISVACSSSGRSERFAAIPEEVEADVGAHLNQCITPDHPDEPLVVVDTQMAGNSQLTSDSSVDSNAASVCQGHGYVSHEEPPSASASMSSPSKPNSTSVSLLSLMSEDESSPAKPQQRAQPDLLDSITDESREADGHDRKLLLAKQPELDLHPSWRKQLAGSVEKLVSKVTSPTKSPALDSTYVEMETYTAPVETTPLVSPSESREQLSRSGNSNDLPGPSAFKIVTPGSSRGSSRAVSREGSMDNLRLMSRSGSLQEGASGQVERHQSNGEQESHPESEDEIMVTSDGKTVRMPRPKDESFL